ncbi:guanine nucleotide-binding protein subunit gamma 3-like isoform X2 [Ananas comosus]|uniref:Guanine nucleotide-binding protein subunit gamma 3-like isoform X2 n=1 Tax=Ananas comosus TaxID=4615 RepID=A0A6P5GG65_ANACO|nr:guanine nucleotide-binding protein subunit gamma 3-like isoform X2 [Ananas comosus]
MAAAEGAVAPPPTAAPPPSPPRPKSPPGYPDLCGRRRLGAAVQVLDREIASLEADLQSLEGLESVSSCCQEVNEFVGTNPDPFIHTTEKQKESHQVGKRFRMCFNFQWICCSNGFPPKAKRPICPLGQLKTLCCRRCHGGCNCCSCCDLSCCRVLCCSRPSCSCPEFSCGCICSCSKFTEKCSRRGCSSTSCISKCLC